MYLQLAELAQQRKIGFTWVKAHERRLPLNDAPINYILNEDGVYVREDYFDEMSNRDFACAMSEIGYDMAELSAFAGRRKDRKIQKDADKSEKTQAKTAIKFAKADAKIAKGAAKVNRSLRPGQGAAIMDSINKSLPQILDIAGNVIGQVKGGTVEPVEPGTVEPNTGGGGSTSPATGGSFWDKELNIFGMKVKNKIAVPVAVVGLAGLAFGAKKFF